MRLEDYIGVIRKRWWVIGLIALSSALAALGFSYIPDPMYRSRAEYTAGVNRLDSGVSLIGAGSIFNNYRNLIANPREMQAIAQQLRIDRTGSQMMEYVTVQPQPSEMKFVIEADYFDVDTSVAIARAVGARLDAIVVEQNRNLTGEDRLTLKEVVPATYIDYSPKKRINMLAGGILGLLLGVLVAFVLEYMDDTLKTSADVERYSDLPTIGSIPSGAARGGRVSPRLRAAPTSGIVAQTVKPKGNQQHDQ